MAASRIACPTCNDGELATRKLYRMSGVVVAIGYILLIPSVIGILFSVFVFFASGSAAALTLDELKKETHQKLVAASVPANVINAVIEMQPVPAAERRALSAEQKRVVDNAKATMAGGTLGAGAGGLFAGGAAFCFGISSLVGGLLGWLLVMKKKVLQCTSCSATVSAS